MIVAARQPKDGRATALDEFVDIDVSISWQFIVVEVSLIGLALSLPSIMMTTVLHLIAQSRASARAIGAWPWWALAIIVVIATILACLIPPITYALWNDFVVVVVEVYVMSAAILSMVFTPRWGWVRRWARERLFRCVAGRPPEYR